MLPEHHPSRKKWEDRKPIAGEGKIVGGLTHHSKELRLYVADGENHTRILNLYFQHIILATRWQKAVKQKSERSVSAGRGSEKIIRA